MFNLPLWRDISIVLLALELIIALAPVCVLLFFCVKYVPRGIRWLRDSLRAIQSVARRIQDGTLDIAHAVISPIIAIQRFTASGKGMVRAALSVMRGK